MKQQPNYGYPFSSILIRMIIAILISLSIVALIFISISWYLIILITIVFLPIYAFFGIINFKKHFYDYRLNIQKKIISLLDIKGNEYSLDLGSGAGALVIAFAKYLENGKAYGLDKYFKKEDGIRKKIIKFIRINYLGHTLENAIRNSKIESLNDRCIFMSGDFTKRLNFKDEFLNIITSFQSLHIISTEKQKQVFQEINRILKNEGKIIFFEPKQYLGWNINNVKKYYKNLGYDINIIQYKTRVIFYAMKPKN